MKPGSVEYSDELADAICESIAGGKSLAEICRWYGMPHRVTVMRWLSEKEDFQAKYIEAHEVQADIFAEQIMNIADDGTNDYMLNKHGDEVINKEHVQRSKLRIEARKWIASKYKPKKYGDKIQTDITSGGKPIKNEYHIHPVTTAPNDNDKSD